MSKARQELTNAVVRAARGIMDYDWTYGIPQECTDRELADDMKNARYDLRYALEALDALLARTPKAKTFVYVRDTEVKENLYVYADSREEADARIESGDYDEIDYVDGDNHGEEFLRECDGDRKSVV